MSIVKIAEEWIVMTFDFSDTPRLLPLLSALSIQRAAHPIRRSVAQQRNWETCLACARLHIAPSAFERAWQQGQSMSWQETLAHLLTL